MKPSAPPAEPGAEAPPQGDLFAPPACDATGPSCPIQPERDELPAEHPARAVMAVLDKLDLRGLYAEVRARGETAGAAAIDPKILLGLWVYATSDGVGSGREIARLTRLHAAYRWLCGGVDVAYHRLNDFRSEQGENFDQLVTQVLARLMQHDLVDLHRVAQDGTRIRASAGAASFRRGETLDALMAEARRHLDEVTHARPRIGSPGSSARSPSSPR
jgi:transposase